MHYKGSFIYEKAEEMEFYDEQHRLNANRVFSRHIDQVKEEKGAVHKTIAIGKIFRSFFNSAQNFKCYCIEVINEDGLTWAAEIINYHTDIEKKQLAAQFNIINFSPTFNKNIPQIAHVIGMKKFLKLSVRYQISKDFFSFHSITTLLVYIAPFIATVAGGLITQDINQFGFKILFTLKYLIILGASFLICYTSLLLKRMKEEKEGSGDLKDLGSSIDQYSNDITEGKENIINRDRMEKLIQAVTDSLFEILPKFVIVEKYEQLDFFTRKVIKNYFEQYYVHNGIDSENRECWVMLENQSADNFSNNAYSERNRNGTAYNQISNFRLRSLTTAEKLKLIGDNPHLNLPLENANRSVIKKVFKNKENIKWIERDLKKYRKEYPEKKFGKLEFLYLLSINANPVKLSLDQFSFEAIYKNDMARSEILKAYMYNIDFHPSIFKNLRDQLVMDIYLRDLVDIKDSETINITPAAASVLNQDADLYGNEFYYKFLDSLALPNLKLGHAFWAVYWFDRLKSRPYEAAWFIKLTYHLLNFDFETIRSEYTRYSNKFTIDDILLYIMEAYNYTITGCLRTAMFQDIEKLVSYARMGIEELSRNMKNKKKNEKEYFKIIDELRLKCWEAYLCLKYDSILSDILIINNLEEVSKKIKIENKNACFFELYFGIIPKHSRHFFKTPDPYSFISDDKDKSKSIEECIITNVSLYSSYINSFTDFNQSLRYGYIQTTAPFLIHEIQQNITLKIQQFSAINCNLLDLVNLSNCIWFFAVDVINVDDNGIANFLSTLNNIIDILSKVQKNEFKAGKQIKNEFLFDTIVTEIAGVSIASCIIFHYNTPAKDEKQKSVFKSAVNTLIGIVNEIFDIKFNRVDSVEDLLNDLSVRKTVVFLESCSALWNLLKFENLYNLLSVRIFYFKASVARIKSLKELTDIINEGFPLITIRNSTLNFISGIIKAGILRYVHSHYSFLFFRNAILKLDAVNYNKSILNELYFLSLVYRSTPYFEHTVNDFNLIDEPKESNIIYKTLSCTPASLLPDFTMRICNRLKKIGDPERRKAVFGFIQEKIESIPDGNLNDYLKVIVNYYLLIIDRRDKQNENIEKLLIDWKEYKEYWCFAALLEAWLEDNLKNETLLTEILSVLNRNAMEDTFNAYFNLSYSVCEKFYRKLIDIDIVVPVNYLRDSIGMYETLNTAECNMYCYLFLNEYVQNGRKTYFQDKYEHWNIIFQEEQSIELRNYLEQGSYFTAFCSIVQDLGSGPDFSVHTTDEINLSDLGEPEPFTKINDVLFICNGFIENGTKYFFDKQFKSDPKFDTNRQSYNVLAQNNLSKLFKFILSLSFSSHIENLMQHYNNVYSEFTLPTGEEEFK